MQSGSPPTNPDGERLTLTTLGSWSLASAGPDAPPGPALGSSKPLALVVYLALAPGRAVRREQLLDLLWADLEPTAAAHALRQTLWILRQRFGEHLVVSTGGELRLVGAVDVDRDAFLSAVESRDYDRAVELYHGDFLPGFAAPGGAEFERWADIERDRLRDTFLRVGDALVRRLLDTSRFREAVALARRVRDADPGHEGGWRLLIEALSSSGGALRAAVEADGLDQMLAAEHREPEPATRIVLRLARQVSDAQAPPSRNGAGSEEDRARGGASGLVAELVGREREFSAVLHAWDAARGGASRHVHVTGAAGIGKTRLLTDVFARLRSTGARTVLIRPNPGERQVAYAFASDLAAALSALPGAGAVSPAAAEALVALNPTLSARFPAALPDAAAGEEALRRRTIALAELVTAVADEAPLALLVDDLHWADHASRQALGGVAAHLGGEPILLVTATRPTPEGTIAIEGTVHVALEPLTPQEIGALVTSLGTLPAEPWSADFAVRLELATHGSPLLILETLQLLLERGLLRLGDDGWRCSDPEAVAAALGEGRALRQRLQQLDRDQRWLLLVLAVIGSPVTAAELLAHLSRGEAALAADLAFLEQRGFLVRAGDQWTPAHDEIAQAAIELASSETLHAAHLGIGRAVAAESDADATLLVRAGQHLAQAGDAGELGRVFTRWFVHQRSRGDRQPAAALAAELLGRAASGGEVEALVRSLPHAVRWGLYSRFRRVAAAAVVLVAAGVAVLTVQRQRASPPDEELIAITRESGGHGFRAVRVPISADRWDESRPLEVATAGRAYPTIRSPADWETGAVYSAARDAWAVTRVMPGADVQELFLIRADGSELRLTDSPGDDVDPSWAPDGSRIAFCSARWSAQSWYHVAVVDPADLRVRQLTFGDWADHSPRWSIDGTRIAFVRQFRGALTEARPLDLCWVSVDGVRQHCTPIAKPFGLAGLSKWLDAGHVAVVVDSGGASSYASVGVEDGTVTIIRRNIISAGTSPDGKWALGIVGDAEDASGAWVVFPVARPDQSTEVRLGGRPDNFVLRWGKSAHALPYVARLVVTHPDGPVPLGTAYRLRVHGITTAADTVTLPAVRWWSGDTATAAVSEDGELVGRRHGALWVQVTAGGWRSDSVRVAVSSATPTIVMREDWTKGWRGAWVPFGMPLPATTPGPGGVPAMWNRGDGSFASGVYSTGSYSAADGVGVEASFSSPVTATQWQTLVLQLDADLDLAALAQWDHRTGAIPRRTVVGGSATECTAGVPGGEGAEWANQVSLGAGQSSGSAVLPTRYTSGRWYRLRLQIFPDGRCGAALDGRPLWISRRPIAIDRPFRVVLSGNSVGTRMLFGPAEVWQGVRDGVDWTGTEPSGSRVAGPGRPRSASSRRLAP
jgi:DNA-binding SARP family transcriptional activator